MSFKPFDVLGQTMSQGVNVFVSGIKGFDSFNKSNFSALSKGVPSPQNALSTLMSLPQNIMPKGGLALPTLGNVDKNLNLNLPTLKPFNEILPPPPTIGKAGKNADDTAIFGAASESRGYESSNGKDDSGDGSGTSIF